MTGPEPQSEGLIHSPSSEGVEPDRPRTGRLFGMIGALIAVLAVVIVGLWVLFVQTTTSEIQHKVLSLPSKEMLEIQARDEGRLMRYDLLDPKTGVYQIPIHRAIEVLLADPGRLAPVPLPAKPAPQGSAPASRAAAERVP